MRRAAVGLPVIGIMLVLLVAGGCTRSSALTKGPYIQNPTPSAITVLWETERPGNGKVCFRAADSPDGPVETVEGRLHESVRPREVPSDTKAPPAPRYLYRARLLNLRPDTEYDYHVRMDFPNGPVASEEHRFRTWPETPPDRVTFIAYGDTRTQPKFHQALTAQFDAFDPAFILHNGDFVGDGNRYDLWTPEFFEPLRDVIDHIPMMVARGNHEEGKACMFRFFDMPGGLLNYSFDYGPVHVIVLDMDKPTPEVLQWLAEDLAAAKAPWKVATYHKPMFNLEGHRSDEYRTSFLPLFEKYGVDLVVSGHTHHYERFFPMRREGAPEDRALTFMTVGGGGAPLYPAAQGPYLAKARSTYCFSVFEVTRDTMTVKTLTDKREVIDTFTIHQKGGRYDEAYLATVRPMEPLMVEQGLSKVGVSARSKTPLPADEPIELEVKGAFPGMTEPVALSVRLSEASARYYRMAPALGWALPDGKETSIPVFVRELSKEERAARAAELAEVKRRARALRLPEPGKMLPKLEDDPALLELKGGKDPKTSKKRPPPPIKLLVTASAGGLERIREMPGIGFDRTSRPAAKWPGPWAEHSDKKPAPVGVTYTAPPRKKEEPKKPSDDLDAAK